MSLERRDLGRGAVILIRGRLDAAATGELGTAVGEEIRRGLTEIAIDLEGVSFLSSAGIRELLTIHRTVKAAGGRCTIVAASESVRQVLQLTRLTPLFIGSSAAVTETDTPAGTPAATRHLGGIRFSGLTPAVGEPLPSRHIGSTEAALRGIVAAGGPQPLPRNRFAIGLGALGDGADAAERAGELAAVHGAVFQRPPQPCAMVDFLLQEKDFVPQARLLSGIVWEGLPTGCAGFEPAGEEAAVTLDELVSRLLELAEADAIGVVFAAEVHGLVGAELIRPLSEANGSDVPSSPSREIAARWLSFSREPVHGRRTALVVGIAARGDVPSPLKSFVRPLGTSGVEGHLHAVVFPHRPLRKGAIDLGATLGELVGSQPLAVMHLLVDPQPVLGSGHPEFVEGCCWFAPLRMPAPAGEAPR